MDDPDCEPRSLILPDAGRAVPPLIPRPRIGVDGYNLAMAHGTGVATYARTLTRAIIDSGSPLDLLYGLTVPHAAPTRVRKAMFVARLAENEAGAPPPSTWSRHVYDALVHPFNHAMVTIPHGGVLAPEFADRLPQHDRLFTLRGLFRIAARHFRRYRRFLTVSIPCPPAIMHWTYPVPVRLAGARNLYTIHDIVPIRLPQTSLENRRYYDALLEKCIASSVRIVTVSERSRTDILDYFGCQSHHVVNTYQPVDLRLEARSIDPESLEQRLDRLFDLETDSYFLFFGAIEPKKNVGRLIEAYLKSGVERKLLIVGKQAWRADEELRLLGRAHGETLTATSRIRLIDHVSRANLIDLVRGARAALFPSLYEGFGLPVLEAMALGTPVMTSTAGALPEIAGDAALLVDPYDTDAMGEAIARLNRDEALIEALAARGPKQADKFSSQRYQDRITALYDAVMRDARPHSR